MKKTLGILLSITMLFTLAFSTTAFAASSPSSNTSVETSDNEQIVRGSLSGYGSKWYNTGELTSGDFYVNVTGIYWPYAQLTLNIESFGPDDAVAIQVFNPNGVLVYGTLEYAGDLITMANANNWHNIYYSNGMTGTYTIHYAIYNFSSSATPSSGRINCWIY